jgi:hypothetical protein
MVSSRVAAVELAWRRGVAGPARAVDFVSRHTLLHKDVYTDD